MTNVQLQAPEIHCDHCKTSLEGAVASLSGVSTVEVTISDATINVDFDETLVDIGSIKEAVEDQGYAVFG